MFSEEQVGMERYISGHHQNEDINQKESLNLR